MESKDRMLLISVTSAGVMSLGIMSVTDRFGATPNTDELSANKIYKDTQRRARHPLLCFGITWVDSK